MKLQIITRFVALGILIAGLLVLATSIGYLLFKSSDESGKPTNLPEQVAGLRVTNTTFGSQALQEIARLHGKEFPLITGAVGSMAILQI